jgi:Ohr subfamily peroxiredoxin
MKPIYTESAIAEGGREGRVHSSDGFIDLTLSQPKAAGGSGTGTNPEALFAAGYSACFHSAMMFVARMQKKDVSGSSVEGHVTIGQKESGQGFELAVKHIVRLPNLDQAEAVALVHAAHEVCPYSNATRGNIAVDFEVHGRG